MKCALDLDVGVRRAASAGAHPHGLHAEALGSLQVGERVFDHDALARLQSFAAQHAQETGARGLGLEAQVLDAVDCVEAALDACELQNLLGVVARCVGEDDLIS